MPTNQFTHEVMDALKWYVYRLIDPRNGETFYVGKGKENRVFAHAAGVPDGDVVVSHPVLQRIKEVQMAGLEVSHVIHRHGIAAEWAAYEVEAALIDAYPGVLNLAGGHGSDQYGCRHVEEIVSEHTAQEFEVAEPLMCICINELYYRLPTYDAVRGMWRVKLSMTTMHKLVLAHVRGLVVGAFRPEGPWMDATKENFPELLTEDMPRKRGFRGKRAEDQVWEHYVGKRVPARYHKKGSRAPVRYYQPGS